MKQYTAASYFATFMLPHVMFVRDFEERKKATMCCCLGWNISLFPDVAQREQHIEMVWKMVEADNQEPPQPGLKEGFKQDLRLLIEQKRDLFPWLNTNIPKAVLRQHGDLEFLSIQTSNSDTEEIPLAWRWRPFGCAQGGGGH